MQKPSVDYVAILETLIRHGVDFIIVGGVCAVLHGAPLATFDLDVVHSRDPDNLTRLSAALEELGALYRVPDRHEMKPSPSHLASEGLQLLMTRFGPLDLLGTIGKGRDSDQLLNDTVDMQVGSGLIVRVTTLKYLIKSKEESGVE